MTKKTPKKMFFIISLVLTLLFSISLSSAYFEAGSTYHTSTLGSNYPIEVVGEGSDDTIFLGKYYSSQTYRTIVNSSSMSFISESSVGAIGTPLYYYDYNSTHNIGTQTGSSLAPKNFVWSGGYSSFKTALGNPYGLQDLTYYNGFIYAIKSSDSTIYVMDVSTTTSTINQTYTLSFNPLGIDYYNDTFYLTKANGNDLEVYLYTTDMVYSGHMYTIETSLTSPTFSSFTINNNKAFAVDNNNDYLITANNITSLENVNLTDYTVLNGNYIGTQYCINSNTVCSNSTVINGILTDYVICDNNSVQYCSGGCENTYTIDQNGIGFYYGTCSQLGCENECNVQFSNECVTSNTYQTCGFYDSDACLDYSSVLYCPTNQYCYSDNLGAYCGTFNETISGSTYAQDSVTVDLRIKEYTGVLFTEYEIEDEVVQTYVETKKNNYFNFIGAFLTPLYPNTALAYSNVVAHTGLFKQAKAVALSTALNSLNIEYRSVLSGTADYYIIDCDYQETIKVLDDITYTTPTNYGWSNNITTDLTGSNTFANTSTTATYTYDYYNNNNIELLIDLEGNNTIELYSGNNLLNILEINYNTTSYTLTVKEQVNDKTLLESTSTSDDINSVYVNLKTISNVDTLNVEVMIEKSIAGQTVNEHYYSLPLLMNYSSESNKLVFNSIDGEQLKIYQIVMTSIDNYPIYTYEESDNKLQECNYSLAGSYIVKAYGVSQNIPTYYFSDEIITNIDSVADTTISEDDVINPLSDLSVLEKLFNISWTQSQKLFYSTFFLFLIASFSIGAMLVMRNTLPIILGSVVFGMVLIYFVLEGFQPLWVILLFAIVGSAVGAMFMKKGFLGKGG